jgi:hypothetical protein
VSNEALNINSKEEKKNLPSLLSTGKQNRKTKYNTEKYEIFLIDFITDDS